MNNFSSSSNFQKFNRNIFTESIYDDDKKTAIISINEKEKSSQDSNKAKKRLKQIESILSQRIIVLSELKAIAWNGIPFDNPFLRAELWRLLLGYTPLNLDIREKTLKKKRQDYADTCDIYNVLLENPSKNMNDSEYKTYKQISVDIPRTMPEYKLFSFERIRKIMLRMLYVWSMRHPASGYVQGFNDLCTPFIVVFLNQSIELNLNTLDIEEKIITNLTEERLFEIESDSYGCFTSMMNKIQNNYTNNQPGLQKMVNKLEDIIRLVDNEVMTHFEELEIKVLQFSFRWMNCYLMREFSLKLIMRLWDTYFSEEDAFNNFHLFVCACLLLNFSDKIKKMDFQSLIMFLQDLPTSNWGINDIEVLLAKAYQINILYGKAIK